MGKVCYIFLNDIGKVIEKEDGLLYFFDRKEDAIRKLGYLNSMRFRHKEQLCLAKAKISWRKEKHLENERSK